MSEFKRWVDILLSGVIEGIGLMVFVYVACGTAVVSSGTDVILISGIWSSRTLLISAAFGFTLSALIYATANLSSAHLNPMVSLALVVTRNCGIIRGCVYVIFQLVGSILGAAFLYASLPDSLQDSALGSNGVNSDYTQGQALLVEAFTTFFLVFVVLNVAYLGSDPSNRGYNMGKHAPLAIGLCVFAIHTMSIPITGTSVNPARSFGPAVVSGTWENHWIFWCGPCIGTAGAVLCYLGTVVLGNKIGLHERRQRKQSEGKGEEYD
mmetsp:Transcript_9626/g.14499  ORF Transcript_9626/g.14499 Transcript_9626/m.14499 type:complete len:266 (-) Transcript_9626:84-881(-)|eukprot:CAMPEP_0201547118 /NCGR_PEP_ID=MMETSP0173_2-20130828/3524_1 /ASSEMBLY_ACC=CAM_ASM_000268 /TAXON_ID=218659 /ORGANISM="Vexillifera sp., Strain DIVA3 564/2" /LENGTH=265 /DNA_ID=CAMNT_0047956039 /DNA_START=78 /DNA_END=875 /DNA_ORIENTATION=-